LWRAFGELRGLREARRLGDSWARGLGDSLSCPAGAPFPRFTVSPDTLTEIGIVVAEWASLLPDFCPIWLVSILTPLSFVVESSGNIKRDHDLSPLKQSSDVQKAVLRA
jgi:hypothetical protein